ncbi:hypothetical protein GH878_06660 [Bacillus thuringiensis]|nr:hypothetical protein [Bacillus thuringiensis]
MSFPTVSCVPRIIINWTKSFHSKAVFVKNNTITWLYFASNIFTMFFRIGFLCC